VFRDEVILERRPPEDLARVRHDSIRNEEELVERRQRQDQARHQMGESRAAVISERQHVDEFEQQRVGVKRERDEQRVTVESCV
jgi:hypothetical protein